MTVSKTKLASSAPTPATGTRRPATTGPLNTPSYQLPDIRDDWLGLTHEDAIDPSLPIIDAHHHLWDWAPHHRYLHAELLDDLQAGHNVVATVYVECGAMYRESGPAMLRPLGEATFVAGVSAMFESGNYGDVRACSAFVGYADLRLGEEVRAVMEGLLNSSGARLRAIRFPTAWAPEASHRPRPGRRPGMLGDPVFRAGFGCLNEFNLAFDTYVFHPQLEEVTDLAKTFPETTIILNHTGIPLGRGTYSPYDPEVWSAWCKAMRSLSECPNVRVKLGGLGMDICGFSFDSEIRPPSSFELANAWGRYIRTCIDFFGPTRCMFESNFPVDKTVCSYATIWNAFKRITSDFSPGEKADLFAGTAARTYGIEQKLVGPTT